MHTQTYVRTRTYFTQQNPTSEDVDKYHAMYVQGIQGLFDRHSGLGEKGEAAEMGTLPWAQSQLEIW